MKSKNIKLVISILVFLCLLVSINLNAQQRIEYWKDSNALLQDQASLIFEHSYKILDNYPPDTIINNERKLALLSIDALLHDTRLDNGIAFKTYMSNITNNVVAKLKEDKPKGNQIRFFRFYNHGFIVQSASTTVAIDIIRGGTEIDPFVDEKTIQSIVDQCDILFISHSHADHADSLVAKMFCEQKKDVIVPEILWQNMGPHLKVLRGNKLKKEIIKLPFKNTYLTASIYPGHQGKVSNNVYAITLAEGKTIMHTGDQDFSVPLIEAFKNIKIDVLLVHCWMMPMYEFVSGINPTLVISGHENEIGHHTIDHREAYWLTFSRLSGIPSPFIVMACGEFYTIY